MEVREIWDQFDGMTLEEAEKVFRVTMVTFALKRTNNHHQKAALLLGIHRNTLTRIMDAAGMPLDRRGGNTLNKGSEAWQALGN